jgi:hypothetical protein
MALAEAAFRESKKKRLAERDKLDKILEADAQEHTRLTAEVAIVEARMAMNVRRRDEMNRGLAAAEIACAEHVRATVAFFASLLQDKKE